VALFAFAMALEGCHDERTTAEALEPPVETRVARTPAPAGLAVDVASVRADVGVDVDAVRVALREAEAAFLSCVDPDRSTGVLTLRMSMEGDGAVGDVVEQPTTTYGTEEARSCMERIVGSMRFPTTQSRERFDIEVTLEVRTRHEGEPAALSPPSGTAPTP
jgi:hypothetical protein